MGYEGGVVTSNHMNFFAIMKKELSFPPRFQLRFKPDKNVDAQRSQNVVIRFSDVCPSTSIMITLDKAGIYNHYFIIFYNKTIRFS